MPGSRGRNPLAGERGPPGSLDGLARFEWQLVPAPSSEGNTALTKASQRARLLGSEVDLLSLEDLQALLEAAVAEPSQVVVANHNLHSLYLCRRNVQMEAFYQDVATYIHIDGMPLVAWARLLGYPARRNHRVTYVDWVRPMMSLATDRRWRVFAVGGRPGVGERAREVLQKELPGLEMTVEAGYFDATVGSEDNRWVLGRIAEVAPQLLLVGMGMPRQELWIRDHLDRIEANVILPSGACLDYVAGVVPTPPRWAGALGLEWLFRLAASPRRLGRRYLLEPWSLAKPALSDLARRVKGS